MVQKFIAQRIMKTIGSQAKAQGIGRYPKETVLKMANEDLEVLSLALGDKNFVMGDEPSELDCTLFAFLVLNLDDFLCKPKTTEDENKDTKEGEEENTKAAIETDNPEKYKNLQTYIPRMKERFWGDWDDLCKEAEEAMAKKEKGKKTEEKESEEVENAKEIDVDGDATKTEDSPEGNKEEKKDEEK